jgi:hypothetical protein
MKKRKPQWWQLYIGLPFLCSLFVVEIDLHLSETYDTVLQLAILGLIFLFMQVWLRANRGALLELDERAPERQETWGVRVYESPAAEPVSGATSRRVSRPLVDIPHGEVRGVLATTFEMDAEESDSVFQARADDVRPEDTLPLRDSRNPAHKE